MCFSSSSQPLLGGCISDANLAASSGCPEISTVGIEYSNGLVENGQPHVPSMTCDGTERRMIRVIRKPYPIYVEQPDGDVRIPFKRERVLIDGELNGIVFKNYGDLERNEGDLDGIEHLMCHGRLADDRVNPYLAKMKSLQAVTILSPMSADLKKIRRYFPIIRAIDLNCACLPCKYDLSVFGKLEASRFGTSIGEACLI